MASKDSLKLIVGIDFGTTYSGLCFALSTATDFKDIIPWTRFPDADDHLAEHNEKAPTRIAFADENVELNKDAWGYQVVPRLTSCAMTKLLLDESTQPSGYDDPSLYNLINRRFMRLPPGKRAEDVVAAYLHGMYRMFEEAVDRIFGSMDELPAEFWVTVPASWSERAKLLTKEAAQRAGFGTRDLDSIMLISEPEAAAHFALKSGIHRLQKFVQPKTGVMVCDCGGGTVDITTYEVERTEPTIKLREIAVGVAGKCGGTFVDRNLYALLTQRFGEAFTSLSSGQIGPGSEFMDQFERKKKKFSGDNPSRRAERLRLVMSLPEASPELEEFYEMRTSSVLLTHDDFKSLFDPVITRIIQLIHDQVSRTKREEGPGIDTIVLVGGFASSPYLMETILSWCKGRGLRVTTPMSGSWSAIVRGAVLRGLEGCIVRGRKCRRHYGIKKSIPYERNLHENYDKSTRQIWKDPFKGIDFLSGFMEWPVSKGENIDKSSEINFRMAHIISDTTDKKTWKLYSCNLDEAPSSIENSRIELVGQVLFKLDATIIRKFESIVCKGITYYEAELTLNVKLDDQMGHLIFSVLHKGKRLGEAKIELDE